MAEPTDSEHWYRPRPIDVEAMQWTGTNANQLRRFAGSAFDEIAPEDRTEDTEATAQICDFSEWRRLRPGDWVLRRGEEFEAMDREEFAETYEPRDSPGQPTLGGAMQIVESWFVDVNDGHGYDASDLVHRLQEAGYRLPSDDPS